MFPLFHARALARSPLPPVALVAIAVWATALPAWVQAQSPADAEQTYAIAPGALAPALRQFASAANILLTFTAEQTVDKHTAGLTGRHPVPAGLQALLAGTGLHAVQLPSGAYVLREVSTVTVAARGDTAVLAPITVTGQMEAETATSAVHGYVARRSATGSRMDAAIIEIPQSLSVVTADEVAAFRSQTLTDALAYTAGVFRSEGNDRTADRLVLRGFAADTIEGSLYRDGMRYMVNAFNGKQEPYGLERIEVLKGAASVLYGAGAPGGVINTISKRPTADLLREVNVEVGSYQRRQVSTDLGGAIDAAGDWTYRLTALRRDSNTFIDFVPDDRTYVAPALTWRPSAATSLTLLSHYQKSRSKYAFGFPPEGTIEPNPLGRIPVNRYLGEPNRDHFDNTVHSVSYLFEHAFSDTLKLRNSAAYFSSRTSMPATWPLAWRTYPNVMSRFAESTREDKSSSATLDLSLEYQWQAGGVDNTLVVGADRTRQRHRSERWLRFPADLDLFAPIYDVPYTDAARLRQYPASRREDHVLSGVYVQNQARLGERWVGVVGGRWDWTRTGLAPIVGETVWDEERSRAFSGRAGVVYLADNGLAPFASWSESFQPQAGTDRTGNRFKPTTGTQYELGVRYQPKDSDMLLSAALYQLTRQNVTTPDAVDDTFNVQTGEVRSRGVELEAKMQATRALAVLGAYTYTDARTTRSTIEADVGKRTGAIARHQFSLWGQLDAATLGLPGVKAGMGLRYVGSSTGTYITAHVPAFTLIDAMLSYETGPWRFSLNAYNLADKVHVTNCIDVCYYGEPRRVIGAVSYRW